MALAAGARLGPFVIVAPLGSGGMGVVYRARDTRLNRDVALKILPDAFAGDPNRLARLTREAQMLASVSHPNIAAIHGLEDADGVKALVMELVDGEDLAQRIARGAIPFDEALPIARQIAEAIEAAHERGIIHRDLKPANIKVRPDGTVKVLDFGLAKETESAEAEGSSLQATITSPAVMTGAGVILGTAAYMSPEQAKGRPADKRSDVWAFGCVLYEMLTGKRAFAAEGVNETLAAVLRGEPEWSVLPKEVPSPIRTLLVRALSKDRSKRFGDMSVARFLLGDPDLDASSNRDASLRARTTSWRVVSLVAASLLIGLAGAALTYWQVMRPATTSSAPTTRFRVALPPGTSLMNPNSYPDLALSPDGRRLVYLGLDGSGRQQLFAQSLDQIDPEPVPGTERGNKPFFSPDGQWIGLWVGDKTLVRLPLAGGAAVKICDVTGAGRATWLPDDSIVFSQAEPGLWRVLATGGTPTALTTPDGTTEVAHRSPHALPGGKAVVFTIARSANYDEAEIGVVRLDGGEPRVLVQGGMDPHYLNSGHVVFARAGKILAVPFDLATLSVGGAPVEVIEDAYTNANLGFAQFALSPTGSLAYAPIAEARGNRSLVWVDRHGAVQPLPAPIRGYEFPRLSPDGRQLAFSITGNSTEGRRDIWVYEFARGTLSRVTSERSEAETPVWTPDGTGLTYATDRFEGAKRLRPVKRRRSDGSGEEVLATTDLHLHLSAWSPGADTLVAVTTDAGGIWALDPNGKGSVAPLFKTQFHVRAPAISPDGRWVAYSSDDTTRFEIYVQAFPGPGRKYQLSKDGGSEPAWGKNGRELYFRNGDKMMAATIAGTDAGLELGAPTMLFEGRFVTVTNPSGDRWYDVTADGQRFLMMKADENRHLVRIQNWSEELKTRVPRK